MTALEKHVLSLQQKVEQLNSEILTLIALTSPEQHTTQRNIASKPIGQLSTSASTFAKKSAVGINRYRQLRASE